jgi:hypothetical protein
MVEKLLKASGKIGRHGARDDLALTRSQISSENPGAPYSSRRVL